MTLPMWLVITVSLIIAALVIDAVMNRRRIWELSMIIVSMIENPDKIQVISKTLSEK